MAAEAKKRLDGRFQEFLDTEESLHTTIAEFTHLLEAALQDKRWQFQKEQASLLQRCSAAATRVGVVHSELRERLRVGGVANLGDSLTAVAEDLVVAHTAFQSLGATTVLVMMKRSGGKVKGDSAVGSGTPKVVDGSIQSQAALVQEAASRPTMRVMRYQMYLDEMAVDAEKAGEDELAGKLKQGAGVVKSAVGDINERVRMVQRRERVRLIAARVRAVPAGITLEEHGREFVMDNDKFVEEGREGYRHLYLFSDAILVVKENQGLAGKLMGSKDTDLKFKRLILLSRMAPDACPVMSEPDAREQSPAARSPHALRCSFTIQQPNAKGEVERIVFHGVREVVAEWVKKIRETVDKLAAGPSPVPAWRLQAGAEPGAAAPKGRAMRLPSSEDLAALNLEGEDLVRHRSWVEQDGEGNETRFFRF